MEETQVTSQVHRIVEQESPATANEMKRNRPRPVRKGPERYSTSKYGGRQNEQ